MSPASKRKYIDDHRTLAHYFESSPCCIKSGTLDTLPIRLVAGCRNYQSSSFRRFF